MRIDWIKCVTLIAASMFGVLALAQIKEDPATDEKVPVKSKSATQQSTVQDRAALEREFQKTLTNVTFKGTWQMTTGQGRILTSPLGEPQAESYTITKAVKLADDYWAIHARIQFGDKDVTIPVPVRVVWAGDTAVITLDEVPLPLLGSYSARVMIHRGFYAGTWHGTNYGGILSGQIVRAATENPSKPPKGKN